MNNQHGHNPPAPSGNKPMPPPNPPRNDRRALVDPSTAWYTADTIMLDRLQELVTIARQPYFGKNEGPGMSLASWLMCEAYNHRFDPDHARALHLAAMIISRVKP